MRSRRGQDEVKTTQDASEKSNMFNPQDSLATPSQHLDTRSKHLETVLRSPHTAKTRLRRACDACVARASQARLKRVFSACGLLYQCAPPSQLARLPFLSGRYSSQISARYKIFASTCFRQRGNSRCSKSDKYTQRKDAIAQYRESYMYV